MVYSSWTIGIYNQDTKRQIKIVIYFYLSFPVVDDGGCSPVSQSTSLHPSKMENDIVVFPHQHDATLIKILDDLGIKYVYMAESDTIVEDGSPIIPYVITDPDTVDGSNLFMRGAMLGNGTYWQMSQENKDIASTDSWQHNHVVEVDGYKGDILWTYAYIPVLREGYVATDPLHIRVKYYDRVYLAKGYERILQEVTQNRFSFTSIGWLQHKTDPDEVKKQHSDLFNDGQRLPYIFEGQSYDNFWWLPNNAWADPSTINEWKDVLVVPRQMRVTKGPWRKKHTKDQWKDIILSQIGNKVVAKTKKEVVNDVLTKWVEWKKFEPPPPAVFTEGKWVMPVAVYSLKNNYMGSFIPSSSLGLKPTFIAIIWGVVYRVLYFDHATSLVVVSTRPLAEWLFPGTQTEAFQVKMTKLITRTNKEMIAIDTRDKDALPYHLGDFHMHEE